MSKQEKRFLSKEDIFSHAGKVNHEVFVDEWGGYVRHRSMTMSERREIRKRCSMLEVNQQTGETQNILDPELFEVWSLIHCVLDPADQSGRRLLFVPDDADKLMKEMSAGPISTISRSILSVSGMAPEALKSGRTAD